MAPKKVPNISKKNAKIKGKNPKLAVKRNKLRKKKQLGIFYQLLFSTLLIIFLASSYFLVIISLEPKEIALLNNKIEKALKKTLGNDVVIGKGKLGFTHYGSFKLRIDGIKVSQLNVVEKKEFFAPILEAELSLWRVLMFNLQPEKIKIIDPTYHVSNRSDDENQAEKNIPSMDARVITNLLSSIKTGDLLVENIEIENAQFAIKGKDKNIHLVLQHSVIKAHRDGDQSYLSSENTVLFDRKEQGRDLHFGLNCRLPDTNIVRCGIVIENFATTSMTDMHATLSILENIQGIFDAKASFSIAPNGQLGKIDFGLSSRKGNIAYTNFFKERMDFEGLSVVGSYDHHVGMLSLSDIRLEFRNPSNNQDFKKSSLRMSLFVNNLFSEKNGEWNFDISLLDVPVVNLDRYWPVFLNEKGIRHWVVSHLNDGMINHATARFSLQQMKEKASTSFILDHIDANLTFSEMGVDYSDDFPTLEKLSGVANFTKKGMSIAIEKGHVLKSKLFDSKVLIEDFADPQVMLKIAGQAKGHAADLLKHAGYNTSFSSEIEKYFNGRSVSQFFIQLPLTKKISLENSYIQADSKITNFKNDYMQGGLELKTKKEIGKADFVTKIDLTNAILTADALDIKKQKGLLSHLNFILSITSQNQLLLQDLALVKKDLKGFEYKVSGDMAFDLKPFMLRKMHIKNENFGANHYDFTYVLDKKRAKQEVTVRGTDINLGALVKHKLPLGKQQSSSPAKFLEVSVISNNVGLLYDKAVQNLYLFLECNNGICHKVSVRGNYGDKKQINFASTRQSNIESSQIKGYLGDIGYLAEGLGISHAVSNVPAKINIMNEIDGKDTVFRGEVELEEGITIYENALVKHLAKDTLFSRVKDKIFSNDKTTFDSVTIDFAVKDKKLILNSLIANNYKIGITAKGELDIVNGLYDVKGMIVPGFIINNLFGIGKIPVIGNVVGVLTGGEGGGVFGIRYEYVKKDGDQKARFITSKVSSFVPTTIKNLFDLI